MVALTVIIVIIICKLCRTGCKCLKLNFDVLTAQNHYKKRPRSVDECVSGPPVKLVKLNPTDCSEPVMADDRCESDTGEAVTFVIPPPKHGAIVRYPAQ